MLRRKISILVFLHRFLPLLEHFWWLQTLTMWVIRNPEKISYTIDTKLDNFYRNNLRKIQNTNFDSENSYFCIFWAIFAYFRVFIFILDLTYVGNLDASGNFVHFRHQFCWFLLHRFDKNLKYQCLDAKSAFWYFYIGFCPF